MFQCFILLFRVTYLVCVPLLFNSMMEPASSSTPATATHHQLCVSLSLCYSCSPKPTEIQIHSVLQPISLQLSTETCLASYSFFRLEDSSWSLFLYEQYNLFRFRYLSTYVFFISFIYLFILPEVIQQRLVLNSVAESRIRNVLQMHS